MNNNGRTCLPRSSTIARSGRSSIRCPCGDGVGSELWVTCSLAIDSNPRTTRISHPMSDAIDKYEADRRAKLDKLAALGLDPWGQRFVGRQFIGPVRELWVEGTEHGKGPKVRVAGRVMAKRIQGKVRF